MSKAASPTRFSGDFDHFYDPNYTADISQKMRVPKRIKVDGLTDDENSTGMNNWSTMLANEKFDMHVPDRILVTGQDQHFGTRAPPRELLLENAIMASDPGSVRVATPPRVITLDEHYFPTADEYMSLPPAPEPTHEEMTAIVKPKPRFNVDHRMHVRESTPPLSAGDSLTTNEEVTHLRRQMAKMNRRMMALELDSLQRQQREKFLYAVGLAYFILKTVLWLGRS
uniref:Mff-like domain-containing protein n=1 Tax=Timema cristinae TaxID=61476 RepID=A0A7R9GT55_TIMCR|nr:unnamed protein product [Timema cristinae]